MKIEKNMRQLIREELEKLKEEKYRIFISSLTPGTDNILGVRIPLLRKLAARIARGEYGDWRIYLKEAGTETFEEIMLQGMVIGYAKADIEELLAYAADFLPLVDNWAVCDSFCSGLKVAKNYKNRVWEFIQPYLNSDNEYEIRFGVVILLTYYVQKEYTPYAFAVFNRIKHDGYYVKMAVAWAVSIYYIYLPELTYGFLLMNELDDFTFNKALQKIMESLRVDTKTKRKIKDMKRQNKS